ncbi:metal-dependent hydrolase [Paenibacillus roseipurpureus]|uniref:Metal-dependent hydrolase n=1 Tax=Paenibacillus roseopurpureus TaxID=2918901 RepID=A0AA96LQX1_9BACL|nr:metal-dependent hydrolase [Paenibacillus sp. MBLB1832]WNR45597.1 metal-dependent hydrolase [Paenibacillus sp. MBLB1832]
MDTGTHLVIGLGLAGLSQIDPSIAGDTAATTAVFIGTIVGSQIPDVDGFLRFKGNAIYIRNHRGRSHSLPALPLWTMLITGALAPFFHGIPFLHLAMWIGIAVCVHVFTDCFNTYGTQAIRPFSEKWISWNIIHIFDPFIFTSHIAALFMWSFHLAKPGLIFPTLYGILALYYIWRTLDHAIIEKGLYRKDPTFQHGDTYTLIVTFNLYVWNVVKKRPSGTYQLGELKNGKLKWLDTITCTEHPAIEASKQHEDIQALLYFSSFTCAEVKEHRWGYEVRWADVRYRHRKQYPFVGVIKMDHNFKTLDSYVGWVNDTKLEKKMRVDLY